MADAGLSERDDRRHPAPPGQEGRDSLFFNLMMPAEELGVLLYTWTDGAGVAGRLVGIWGAGREALALDFASGLAIGDADFDDWRVAGFEVRNTEPLRTAQVRYRSERVEVAYDFTGIHAPFPYSRNAEGCPPWMAQDRFEQAGRVVGEVVIDGRRVSFDQLGHRDHSWGPRAWTVPQHWKWIAAQAGEVALNVMFWVARGEPGVNGYVLRDGVPVPIVDGRAHAEYDDDMAQRRLDATIVDASGATTTLEMDSYGVLRFPATGGNDVFEAACTVRIDGEPGSGQYESLWPTDYIQRLVKGES